MAWATVESSPDSESAESSVLGRASRRLGVVLKGKYTLDRVLGVGGMAAVYVATHRNRKRFAVKMLHPELSVHPDIRGRFLREGYAANTVEHPGAVAVLDDDTAEDGSAFLVMELLEGDGVESLWEKHGGRLPVPAVLAVGHQLLDVLAAAHAKGIVHRDIKPANLFLTQEGQLKVLDFGIARVRDVASSSAQTTGTGVLLGTPAFMAPEQALAKSREVDALTDVWAAGATLFVLASGRIVHEAENAAQVMISAATTRAKPLASFGAVPAPLASVVDRALVFEKAGRWASAGAMRDAAASAYEAIVGRPVSRDPLVALFASADAGATAVQGKPAWSLPTAAAVSAPIDSPVGGTTSQPVAMGGGTSETKAPAPRRTGLVVGGIAGAAVVAVAVVGVLKASHPPAGDAASHAAAGSVVVASFASSTPPAPAPSEALAPGAPSAQLAAASAMAEPAPSAIAHPPSATSHPTPAGAARPSGVTAVSPATATKPAATKPNTATPKPGLLDSSN